MVKENPKPGRRRSGVSRREQKQETRDALIAAATEAFAEEGLDVPSLDSICARAGYTRGAFYVHFADREELQAAVMEHLLGRFLSAIVSTEEQSEDFERTVDRFTELILPLAGGASGDLPFHNLLDASARSDVVRERFAQLLLGARAQLADAVLAGQGSTRVRGGVEPVAAAELLIVIALGILSAVESRVPFDPAALRQTVLALFTTKS